MSDKPTIVLVHGFWGGAAHWSKVIVELSRKGYTALRAVELPLTSLADDTQRTHKRVAQQAGPVLLVGHSYGGAVISEAGDMPNVVGLVSISPPSRPTPARAPAASARPLRRRRLPILRPTAMAIYGLRATSFTRASARI